MNITASDIFGYRLERATASSLNLFCSSPFYYTTPREIDKFGEREDLKLPEGKAAAGLWYFDGIESLINGLRYYDRSFVTRVNVSRLQCNLIVKDKAFINGAFIAISYYSQEEKSSDQFVKSLPVSSSLVDVWLGNKWVNKENVSLLDLEEVVWSQMWGRYKIPTTLEASMPTVKNHISLTIGDNSLWCLPSKDISSKRQKYFLLDLYRHAKHVVTIRKFRNRKKRVMNLLTSCAGQEKVLYAQMRCIEHEITCLIKGKDFWEINSIDDCARSAFRLQHIDNCRALFEEIPISSRYALHQHMMHISGKANRARVEVIYNLCS